MEDEIKKIIKYLKACLKLVEDKSKIHSDETGIYYAIGIMKAEIDVIKNNLLT